VGWIMSAVSNAPMIVRRKKGIAAGHHECAWKGAHADAVTAMMSFFPLIRLLGATKENHRVISGRRDFLTS
jgi:chemotaxis protein MotB